MPRPKIDAERRAQILNALETCAIRNGIAKTTLSDVAREADLPRPLVRYFMGNRDDMIVKLFDKLVERGEEEFARHTDHKVNPKMSDYLDFLFDGGFSNKANNKLITELSYFAESNERAREKLKGLYESICLKLADMMREDNIGGSQAARHDAAYSIFSLYYGYVTFRDVGLLPNNPKKLRKAAELILDQLGPAGRLQ